MVAQKSFKVQTLRVIYLLFQFEFKRLKLGFFFHFDRLKLKFPQKITPKTKYAAIPGQVVVPILGLSWFVLLDNSKFLHRI